MAGGIDWFRWHHGSVTDPKFALIARRAGVSVATVVAVWAFVLEKASAASERGHFGDIDTESVDCLFGLNDGDCERVLKHMRDRSLVADGFVCAWERRQPKREREDDSSTERARAFRERKRQEAQAPKDAAAQHQAEPDVNTKRHATPCNAMQRQETPRGEESREEEITHPLPFPEGREKLRGPVGLKAWIEAIKAEGQTPVPPDDPVFAYAESVGIPDDFLRLAWLEFRHRYTQPNAKRYRDWRAVFRKAVRGNWLHLWYVDADEAYRLTTVGVQAQRAHAERLAA